MGNISYVTNIFCHRPQIMDDRRKFNKKRTVKVRGVWQLLQEQIEKEFQSKENSTEYTDDVNNLHICPNGEDYILVEFLNDISGKFSKYSFTLLYKMLLG
jgi:hypothetical protein